jgi:hypothetical protein
MNKSERIQRRPANHTATGASRGFGALNEKGARMPVNGATNPGSNARFRLFADKKLVDRKNVTPYRFGSLACFPVSCLPLARSEGGSPFLVPDSLAIRPTSCCYTAVGG